MESLFIVYTPHYVFGSVFKAFVKDINIVSCMGNVLGNAGSKKKIYVIQLIY